MGWVFPAGYRGRRRWSRHGRRLEAALVGATGAVVFLILRPAAPATTTSEMWPDDILYRPADIQPTTAQPSVPGYDDSSPQVVIHAPADRRAPGGSSVRVVDGDGLEIDGQRIRLHGVDAFEYDQRCGGRACGEAARAVLSDLVRGRTVECRPVDVDRYGRTVARCFADGQDIGAAMVRDGMALAYRRYSSDYVDEEAAPAGLAPALGQAISKVRNDGGVRDAAASRLSHWSRSQASDFASGRRRDDFIHPRRERRD